MAWKTWFQSQVESYQRLKKWYLMPPCLTVSTIRCGSRVKWSNPGKGVAPSPTPLCSSYRKGSLRVTLDYSRQLYLLIIICYQAQWHFTLTASSFLIPSCWMVIFIFFSFSTFYKCLDCNIFRFLVTGFQCCSGPVGWGCKIYMIASLQRGKTPPRSVMVWWWGSNNAGALGNAEYPFIAIVPRSNGSNWAKQYTYAKLNCFEMELFWHLTVCKQKLYLY